MPKSLEQSVISIQKNVSFSSVRLGIKNSKFYLTLKYSIILTVSLRNSNSKEETYYSERALQANKLYHVVIRSAFDSASSMHNVSLFVNGYPNLSTIVKNFTPFDNSKIVAGQYRSVKHFNGIISNVFLFFYPVTEEEVLAMA